MCSNCVALLGDESGRKPVRAAPVDEPTPFDDFVSEHVPVGLALEIELGAAARIGRAGKDAEAAGRAESGHLEVTELRTLTDEETLLVRKILACAARMEGRFGKGMLASTLRGSRARNLLQAHLDDLSTYGILNDMTQEELMTYIDALVASDCLRVTGGTYPTVSLTALGADVMRQHASVKLALAESAPSAAAARASSSIDGKPSKGKSTGTIDETYSLYTEGLSIEEICERRGLTEMTIEKHLAECIMHGRPFDISRYVADADRASIEIAIDQLGTQLLKPLREALPPHITYRMIRFVVADAERGIALKRGDSA